jgi:putative SOS response-associated peptidase YedK
MCFDYSTMTRTVSEYKDTFKEEHQKFISETLESTLKDTGIEIYHTNGFQHRSLPIAVWDQGFDSPIFTNAHWGLIPQWAKDTDTAKSIRTKTINARGETIFDKPSFRMSAVSGRAVIPMDGFYEHHHSSDVIIPYYIYDTKPIYCAGLYSEWTDKTSGEIVPTFSMVTCRGNGLMTQLHNNPKASGPRMPFILDSQNDIYKWLSPHTLRDDIQNMIQPLRRNLEFYPVQKIRGKYSLGNSPRTRERFEYDSEPIFRL